MRVREPLSETRSLSHTLGQRKSEAASIFREKLLPGCAAQKQDTLGAADWRLLRSRMLHAAALLNCTRLDTWKRTTFLGPTSRLLLVLATVKFKGQFWRKKDAIKYSCKMLSGCCWRPRAPCHFLMPTGPRTAGVVGVALVEGVDAKNLINKFNWHCGR